MSDALTRLVAWQQGGEGRFAVIETRAAGDWMVSISWHKPDDSGSLRTWRRAADPDAAIDAAMRAFEERERNALNPTE